jgi:hypothetical protein
MNPVQEVIKMKKILTSAAGALLSTALILSGGSAAVLAEGEDSSSSATGTTPPSDPSGSGGTPPSAPGGTGGAPGTIGTTSGGSTAVTSWDAETEFSSDTEETGGTYVSTGTDENTILVSGGEVVLTDPIITRDAGDSSGGDNASFYGVGAALLTTAGTSYISGGSITTTGNGAAGAFAYSDGVIYIADTTISTEGDTAGAIHVAGGGTLYAYNVTAVTQGGSSAAIRSDRGGGTMVVDGGSFTSNGTGSPAVYVTADITISEADLTATASEALCLEGLNTVRLFNSNLTGNMADDSQNDSTWTVILYQSMSGDSEVGEGSFYMIDGTLTSQNGGIFYTTNTDSTFYLENVDITESADCEYFLRVSGNANQRGWGTTGANGANTNFTAVNQIMNGDVIWDSISTLDFYMSDGSVLTGAVIDDETYAGTGGSGYASVYIDADSKWVVTGDSTVTNLYNEGTIVDADGNTVSIVGSDGTSYVEGSSDVTITVTGTYDTTADFSGAVASVSYDDYKVDRPSQLGTAAEVTATAETEASAESTDTTTTTTEEESSSSNMTLIVVIIAIAAAAAVLIGRKQKQ